ncbi:glucose-1-phosphate thymidylyltransferase [Natrinema thermotolerans]|uniref:Glucose-1-phosphate thymidylyltransferase n=1 Tax=Natrinema thermotolerans TaxID=121872 RepID=A0AAF0PAT1_9EURY|nr:glucose-1-phosphate thymidylyltransferase [Natrinema thermotolerans]QCC60457.1 glucose-1-phosphate thymidylyltransferase [Natrinema thermotolerans]QCC61360.1 glucose-1-phosphate thymidylyltransferase [Natrinema thermotolerans]WMT07490.1 glucose-1-phosphate thymidylyltransferase [Natrinema thermotolerans]WMT08122.1 glucose-1-phosphate thymidylyltransferase [Natrinema thermotolerans]
MKGVLLSGGTGSRLRPITHTGPKQLVPVANKPVLEYAIEDLKEAGVTEIGVVLGHKGREEIQELLGDGSDYGVDITYIVQGNPLGLAHAAGCARDFVGDDDFVMYLGDNILKQGIADLVESFERGDYGAGIALQEVDTPEQFGIADVDDDGTVTQLIEKPDDPPTNLALIGIYVFSNEVFDVIERLEPSWRGELEITDAIQTLLEDGHSIDSHVVQGWWKDTGKPEDILEANRLVLEDEDLVREGRIGPDATVEGRIELHETATIEDGAVVRGPVSIGPNTVVESGTYVGPYTSIGPESTLEGVHIENSVVIGASTIATNGKIVDSLLGRGANVGRADDQLPEGRRLVVGENSQLKL